MMAILTLRTERSGEDVQLVNEDLRQTLHKLGAALVAQFSTVAERLNAKYDQFQSKMSTNRSLEKYFKRDLDHVRQSLAIISAE